MGGADAASLGFRPWAPAPSPSRPGLGLEPGTFPVESHQEGTYSPWTRREELGLLYPPEWTRAPRAGS